jgi:hypothetical protein
MSEFSYQIQESEQVAVQMNFNPLYVTYAHFTLMLSDYLESDTTGILNK